jgi:hypothetical protein
MKTTYNENIELNNTRTAFIETLSYYFIALTGCGVYVYLTPIDINTLFSQYLKSSESIQFFARQCVKSVVR